MRKIAIPIVSTLAVVAIVAAVVSTTNGRAASAPPDTPAAVTPASDPTLPAPTVDAPALDDATIVAIFDAANTADIETGELAASRGASKEVRDFGAMLAVAHRQVREQGRELARKLEVTPTPPADDASAKTHAAAMERLGALEGAEFDRAFLAHEIAFHKGVIDAVTTTLLPAIGNAELRALVVKVAPAFEAHMLGAQNLERRLAAGASGR
jgi:putative membrane protein